jgi:hypothetical protein
VGAKRESCSAKKLLSLAKPDLRNELAI